MALPAGAWYPAIEADGQVHDGAEVAELTGLLYGYGTNLPSSTRLLVRRVSQTEMASASHPPGRGLLNRLPPSSD